MRYFLIIIWLCITTSVHAEEVCEINRPSIVERIENRSYPSVFGAWGHELLNYPRPDNIYEWSYYKEMLAHNDLFVGGANLGIQWRFLTLEGVKLVAAGALWLPIERKIRYSLKTRTIFTLLRCTIMVLTH